MKISKTAVLALGGVFLTAGLGLMVVNAATVEQYKDLLLDLNNAVQHFDTVRFINGSGTSKVDLKRIGSNNDPLLGISLNNLIITESGSVSDENKIEHVSNSSILGGKKNQIKGGGTGKNVILGGEGNTINAGGRDVILGGSGNEISNNVIRGVILGGEGNKVKGSMSTNIGNKNVIGGQASVAVGRNNVVNGSYSAALGVSGTVSKDRSFLWTDKSFEVNKNDVFVINGENGMVIGGNKAHSLAKLTISGSLFISIQNTDTCNPSYKGAIKIMNGRNSGKCFCSCNGSGWSSLNGKGSCIDVCASANNRMFPVCGSDTTCNSSDISYQGSCEVGQLVQGEGAHFIDKDNLLHWKCMTDNGAITPCTGSVPSGCPSQHYNGSICGDTPEPKENACIKGVRIPNDEDAEGNDPFVGDDWLDHRYCKYGADLVEECHTNTFCGNKFECINGATWPGSGHANPRDGDPNYQNLATYYQWTCEKTGISPRVCKIEKEVECSSELNETVQNWNVLKNDPNFDRRKCTKGNPRGGREYADRYTRQCERGGQVEDCTLYFRPECGTATGTCAIGTPTTSPWKCTNKHVTINCPTGNEEVLPVDYSCVTPNGGVAINHAPGNANQSWEDIRPKSTLGATGDRVRKCYESGSGETVQNNNCEFKCKPNFYCTDVDYQVDCVKPRCVGDDDLGDSSYVILHNNPRRNDPHLNQQNLTKQYEYKNVNYTSTLQGCYYKCKTADNEYEDPISGKVRCYDTGTVAALKGLGTPGICTGRNFHGSVFEWEGKPGTGKQVPRLYVPRYGTNEWDQEVMNQSGCLWTCNNASNGQDTYHCKGYVEENSDGNGTRKEWSIYHEEDCWEKCGPGEIYGSNHGCHSCANGQVPDPSDGGKHTFVTDSVIQDPYKQPIRCARYTCPPNYELDTSSSSYDTNTMTYKRCVCNGTSADCVVDNNYRYDRNIIHNNSEYSVCVDINGRGWTLPGSRYCI